MSKDPSRRSTRVDLSTRVRVRGACGSFEAIAEDISLTGLRVRVMRDELRIADDADLATAAATVQTRIGSRCVVELGLRQMSRPLSRKVDLVRLVLPGSHPDSLGLGCRFDEPLTPVECRALRVTLPFEVPAEGVRQQLSWEAEPRPALDPALAEEKVESLFGVESAHATTPNERVPQRRLAVILTAVDGLASGPLVCSAQSLTDSTILVRVQGDQAGLWLTDRRDLSEVAQAVKQDYGVWPELEIADGGRRLWRGGVSVCGLEVGDGSDQDVFLRFAFGRRLPKQDLERICTAA